MSSELRLPAYFPKAHKDCREVSNTFFDCFSDKSQKSDPSDLEAGERGLKACATELNSYTKCMDAVKLKFDFRVNIFYFTVFALYQHKTYFFI